MQFELLEGLSLVQPFVKCMGLRLQLRMLQTLAMARNTLSALTYGCDGLTVPAIVHARWSILLLRPALLML